MIKQCVICKTTFTTTNPQKQTCCGSCARKLSYQNRKPRPKKSYTKTCPICGKEFVTFDKTTQSCSVMCGKALNWQHRKNNHPLPNYTHTCVICGNTWTDTHVKATKETCSSACYSQLLSQRQRIQYASERL